MEQLYSLQAERHLLSGIIKFPDMFFEIDQNYNKQIFFNELNKTIYTVLGTIITSNEKTQKNPVYSLSAIDTLLLGQKIRDLGITKFEDDIDIIDYVQSLGLVTITKPAILETANELEKLRICRDIKKTGEKIIKHVQTVGSRSVEQILGDVDKIYNETVKLTSFKEQPKDLLHNIIERIEERAKNPLPEMGLITPHDIYNRKFGGLRGGNIYAYVSRPKGGKTSYLNDLAIKSTQLNNCKALVLDTEMKTEEMDYRIAAAISNIPSWWLETGNWIKRQDYIDAWYKAKEIIRTRKPIQHINVAGKPIIEVCSLVRRWFYQNIDHTAGQTAAIVYDYIKLTGEKSNELKEYQLIGEKINILKELSLELDVPILTSCQLNRDAERGVEDSSAIALSDRLSWFASFVGIFRKKRLEEIQSHTEKFGTHLLSPLFYRFEGREAFGHADIVRIPEGNGWRYEKNFINYTVQNFNVQENGDLRDILNAQEGVAIQPDYPEEDDATL